MTVGGFFKKVSRTIVRAVKVTFRYIISVATSQNVEQTLVNLVLWSKNIMPVVKTIAAITTTQVDDVLVVLVERLQVKVDAYVGMTKDQQSAAKLAVARAWARKMFPDLASMPDKELNQAIDLAYLLYSKMLKSEQEEIATLDMPESEETG